MGVPNLAVRPLTSIVEVSRRDQGTGLVNNVTGCILNEVDLTPHELRRRNHIARSQTEPAPHLGGTGESFPFLRIARDLSAAAMHDDVPEYKEVPKSLLTLGAWQERYC